MPGVCILGDKSKVELDTHGCPTCPHPHATGPAISGSPNVNINGLPAVREGDVGIHAACCGTNTWKPMEASGAVFVNNQRLVRKGDKTRHCGGIGKMVTASGNVHDGSPSLSLILKQLTAVLEGVLERNAGMREVLAGNVLLMAYEKGMSGDDLDGLAEKIRDAPLSTIETMNMLSWHSGLKPYMVKSGTSWLVDRKGDLLGFSRWNEGNARWVWTLDGNHVFAGEEQNLTSPNDLTNAIVLVGTAGGSAFLEEGGEVIAGEGLAEGAAGEAGSARPPSYVMKMLEDGREAFKKQIQKGWDAVPKNSEELKATIYNQALKAGNQLPGDGRPGPMPGNPPPEGLKDAGKQVLKVVIKKHFGL